MKAIKVYTLILSVLIITSCNSGEKQEQKENLKSVTVKTTTLKSELLKNTKSYFGTLKFSKSTNFVTQQSGIISTLNASPGQKVTKGEVIVIYPPIDHQLQIDQATIQRNKTLEDYNRQKELYKAGAVTRVSVEDYKAQLDIDAKTLQQLQRVNRVTAPFTGIITQVHVTVGQEVSMDMPIFSMAQTNNVEIDFFVTPKEIGEIKLNMPVFFMKDETKIGGKITKRSFQLDEQRRAYLVTATFENQNILFAGNTIDVLVETGTPVESIWIPVDAFRKEGNTFYAFVVENGKALKKVITIGKRNERQVQVNSGLNSGDQLIVAGIDKLKDSIAVKVASGN